ncbi:hypothetical protein CLOP_g584 [Closterium sp. NIES-67]|nr:hypothetical protein CLOP_g584 [Closterium sp. NIES-67]
MADASSSAPLIPVARFRLNRRLNRPCGGDSRSAVKVSGNGKTDHHNPRQHNRRQFDPRQLDPRQHPIYRFAPTRSWRSAAFLRTWLASLLIVSLLSPANLPAAGEDVRWCVVDGGSSSLCKDLLLQSHPVNNGDTRDDDQSPPPYWKCVPRAVNQHCWHALLLPHAAHGAADVAMLSPPLALLQSHLTEGLQQQQKQQQQEAPKQQPEEAQLQQEQQGPQKQQEPQPQQQGQQGQQKQQEPQPQQQRVEVNVGGGNAARQWQLEVQSPSSQSRVADPGDRGRAQQDEEQQQGQQSRRKAQRKKSRASGRLAASAAAARYGNLTSGSVGLIVAGSMCDKMPDLLARMGLGMEEEVWEQQARGQQQVRQQEREADRGMHRCSGEGVVPCLRLLQQSVEEGLDSSTGGRTTTSSSSSSSRKRPVVALLWLAGSQVSVRDWKELLAEVNASRSLRLMCADGSCSDIRLDSLCWLLPPGSLWLRQHRADDVAWLAWLMARHIITHTWNISLPLALPPLPPLPPRPPPLSSQSPSSPPHSPSSPLLRSLLPLLSLDGPTSQLPLATPGVVSAPEDSPEQVQEERTRGGQRLRWVQLFSQLSNMASHHTYRILLHIRESLSATPAPRATAAVTHAVIPRLLSFLPFATASSSSVHHFSLFVLFR